MNKVTEKLSLVWKLLEGKKSYIAGLALIAYGVIEQKTEAVLTGLTLLGVRHGITTEIARLNK